MTSLLLLMAALLRINAMSNEQQTRDKIIFNVMCFIKIPLAQLFHLFQGSADGMEDMQPEIHQLFSKT
jgi:hypothetical protein